jgi:hypothetical protein
MDANFQKYLLECYAEVIDRSLNSDSFYREMKSFDSLLLSRQMRRLAIVVVVVVVDVTSRQFAISYRYRLPTQRTRYLLVPVRY